MAGYATTKAQHAQYGDVGNVTAIAETIQYFDVVIDGSHSDTLLSATEYVIRLNGRVIKRMTPYQAERYGLIQK